MNRLTMNCCLVLVSVIFSCRADKEGSGDIFTLRIDDDSAVESMIKRPFPNWHRLPAKITFMRHLWRKIRPKTWFRSNPAKTLRWCCLS